MSKIEDLSRTRKWLNSDKDDDDVFGGIDIDLSREHLYHPLFEDFEAEPSRLVRRLSVSPQFFGCDAKSNTLTRKPSWASDASSRIQIDPNNESRVPTFDPSLLNRSILLLVFYTLTIELWKALISPLAYHCWCSLLLIAPSNFRRIWAPILPCIGLQIIATKERIRLCREKLVEPVLFRLRALRPLSSSYAWAFPYFSTQMSGFGTTVV